MTPVREAVMMALRDGGHVPTDGVAAAADAALAVIRERCLAKCAAIRAEGHLTDTDDEQQRREQRALVAWQLAEMFGGKDG